MLQKDSSIDDESRGSAARRIVIEVKAGDGRLKLMSSQDEVVSVWWADVS